MLIREDGNTSPDDHNKYTWPLAFGFLASLR